ncbi:MAG: hypothetical protein CME36_11630 [unclassified Hahellaceae]|nr:hypothetical protein [Hahellaceae bacterium]|tara:strand:+ start:4392 stop:7109 length:2718 start_codon:yes stop_codon:yes gene_type:complete
MSNVAASGSGSTQLLPQQQIKDSIARLDQGQNPGKDTALQGVFERVSNLLDSESTQSNFTDANATKGEGTLETFVASFKQDRVLQSQPKDPALQEAESKVHATLTTLASDADGFHTMFKQIYGERYNPDTVEALRSQVLAGDFSSIPEIKVVSGDTLHGNHAAYGDGTIFLNEALLEDTGKAAAYIIEELGHHYDGLFGPGDTKGDEGEMFRVLTSGQPVSADEMNRIRSENDKGTIEVDGKQIEVEFGFISKICKSVKKAVGGIVDKIRDAVKDFANALMDVAKFSMQLMTFPLDYAMNGDEAIDRLKESGMKALQSVMKSEIFQWALTAAVTFFTAGTMTGPLLLAQEAAKYGVVEALKTAAVQYLKSEVVSLVATKVAKETGSEWLGAAVGAFLNKPNSMSELGTNLQEGWNKLSAEQVQNFAKDEVLKLAKTEVLKKVESEVDFVPLRNMVSGWVEKGANWDTLSEAASSLDKQLGKSVKDIDWAKLLEKSKGLAEDLAVNTVDYKVADKAGLEGLGNSMKSFVRSGFDLALLPQVVETASKSGLDELSNLAIDRVTKEIGFAPLREKLVEWVEDGTDYDRLAELLTSAPEVIGRTVENFSWEEMYGKTADALKSETLKQIEAKVDYEPLQNGLRTWVEGGATIDGLDALYEMVEVGVNADIDEKMAKFDEASAKASEVFNHLSAKSGEIFSTDALQKLLGALDGKAANSSNGPDSEPMNFSDLLENLTTGFGEKLQAQINNGVQKLDYPAVGNALSEWASTGAQPDKLGKLFEAIKAGSAGTASDPGAGKNQGLEHGAMKAEFTADILGSINTASIQEIFNQLRTANDSLGNFTTRFSDLAEKLPNVEVAESVKETVEKISPRLIELLDKGDGFLSKIDDVKQTNEKRAQQLNQVLLQSA